jgi:predicted metal-dependent hydrolase
MARTAALHVAGRDIEIPIRRSARARRIAIRVDQAIGGAELVLPSRASEAEGIAFLKERLDWLVARLDDLPGALPFRDGVEMPLRGIVHRIVHVPEARRGVWAEDGCILVSGGAEHLPRRLKDWLRREARTAIAPVAAEKSLALGRRHRRIAIRDQRSRWGSCSSTGDLSFNWRLVLAPPDVLDYVVAHEVGHLAQPNHSPAFWAVVERLTPHARTGRRWLRANGATLFRYGQA